MAGFKAEGVVEPLDYDFRPYVKADGTIPEPSDKQIAEFLKALKALAKEVQEDLPTDIDMNDPSSLLGALDDLDPEVMEKLTGKMGGIYAALCTNTPTEKQITDLPPRIRTIFYNWLQQEVMNPEAATGGGNAQVTNLRGARAG